eukprot:GEMP01008201.1.p1 GENE.GEMP01008201.1~~GEMP01008201.1.p1  ORF type:complete len:460 (+),score=93.56 GEMP01008201.1:421-1800(+)
MRIASALTLAFLCIVRSGEVPQQCGTPLLANDKDAAAKHGINGTASCGDCTHRNLSTPATTYLEDHNVYRCLHRVTAIEWSPHLECLASKAATLLQGTNNRTTASRFFPMTADENVFDTASKGSVVQEWYILRDASAQTDFQRVINPRYTHIGCSSVGRSKDGAAHTLHVCYYHISSTGLSEEARRQSERWMGTPGNRDEVQCRSLLKTGTERDTAITTKAPKKSDNIISAPILVFAIGVPIFTVLIVIAVLLYFKGHSKKEKNVRVSEASGDLKQLKRDAEDNDTQTGGTAIDDGASSVESMILPIPTTRVLLESANFVSVKGSIALMKAPSPHMNNTLSTLPGGTRTPSSPSSAKQRSARRPVMTVKDLPRGGLEESLTASAMGESATIGKQSKKKERRTAALATERAKKKKKRHAHSVTSRGSPSLGKSPTGGLPEVDIPSFVSGGRRKRAKHYTL